MKKYITFTAAFMAVTLGGALTVAAAEKKFLTMDSFPAGSTPGQFGIAFTQIIQKKSANRNPGLSRQTGDQIRR